MAAIRPMQPEDVERVAELHHAAMGNSLWAQLGMRFLRVLYRALIQDEHFLGFVYEDTEQVGGFIAGSQDTDAMLRRCFGRAWLSLGVASLPRSLSPAVLTKLLQTARYTDTSGGAHMPESLFCTFEPELRGRRISGHINKVLFDELLARGHARVKITTEADNEGANRQLTSWGFTDAARFEFYGKQMIRYELDLTTSERVEPFRRHPSE
jgi:RimJ/RimL family protein N-acetyltransferase